MQGGASSCSQGWRPLTEVTADEAVDARQTSPRPATSSSGASTTGVPPFLPRRSRAGRPARAPRRGVSDAEEAFRAELLAFLDAHTPPEARPRSRLRDRRRRRRTTVIPRWAREWQATLFDHGWMVPGYPPELGGRNCTPTQTLVYLEELAPRGHAAVAALRRLRHRRALAARVRQRGAAGAGAGRHPRRHRVVHRHERAGRRLRPRRLSTRARRSTATASSSTARRSGRRYAMLAEKCFCYVRTDPTCPSTRASRS